MVPFQKLPGATSLLGAVYAQGTSAPISRKSNLTATVAPAVTDDNTGGYGDWSVWVDTTANKVYVCADATTSAAIWREISPYSMGTRLTITASNSFAARNVIRQSGSSWALAQGDSLANAEEFGLVESASGSAFTAVMTGALNAPSHGFTVGSLLYLSAVTAGLLTTTAPSAAGTVKRRVAVAVDANTLVVLGSESFLNVATGAGDYAQDTGLTNAYVVDPNPAISAYAAGVRAYFKAANTNTGASTINLNSLGAVTIKKSGSQDLQASDIVTGSIYLVMHDGTNFQLLTPIFQPIATTANFIYAAPDNASGKPSFRAMVARDVPETVRHDAQQYNTSSGTSTAYTLSLTPAPTAYFGGMVIRFLAHTANAIGPVTINVNGLGAKTIKKNVNQDLAASDILNGQVIELCYDGSNFQYQFPQVSNPQLNQTTITANGTFTVPSGVTKIKVTCVGAGGGGGGSSSAGSSSGASGGGAGATSVKLITTTAGTAITVTIGAAGTAGASAGGTGGTGADTTFGALLTGKGGVGGVWNSGAIAAGGAGGATSAADYSVSGQTGKPSIFSVSSINISGAGGDSLYGFGGGALIAAGVGNAAKGFGGGGGGAIGNNAGGAGTAGLCLVEYVG